SVPINTIRVVPKLKVDPDYTLDDFIYTPPQNAELAHPEKYTVHFADGERILCNDVGSAEAKVRVHCLPAGLPDRSRLVADPVRDVKLGEAAIAWTAATPQVENSYFPVS